MPIFLAALLGGFTSAIGSWVGRVLVSLGIGYVTYQGLDLMLGTIKDHVINNLLAGAVDPQITAAFAMLKVGQAVNVIFSAIITRNVIDGLSGTKITKTVIK